LIIYNWGEQDGTLIEKQMRDQGDILSRAGLMGWIDKSRHFKAAVYLNY